VPGRDEVVHQRQHARHVVDIDPLLRQIRRQAAHRGEGDAVGGQQPDPRVVHRRVGEDERVHAAPRDQFLEHPHRVVVVVGEDEHLIVVLGGLLDQGLQEVQEESVHATRVSSTAYTVSGGSVTIPINNQDPYGAYQIVVTPR